MNLYQHTVEQSALLAQIEQHTDPETGELDPQFAADLEAVEIALADKIAAVEGYRRGLLAEAKAFRDEEVRTGRRAAALEARHAALGRYIETCMDLAGIDRIKAGTFSLRLQANPPALVVEAGAEVPAQYFVPQPPKLDRAALKDALKSGEQIAGCRLEQGRSLRVQ